MVRIAHIVNVTNPPPESDLVAAQPVTIASMRAARTFAQGKVDVEFYSVHSHTEKVDMPDGFLPLRPLERDINDIGSFRAKRPLPLLRDILDRLYEESDADYFVYTNVDIALMPHFYTTINYHINKGYDALVINRRNIPTEPNLSTDLPIMYTSLGTTHPGYDCFVFRRNLYPHFVLGDVCLGIGHVDLPLICSMIAACKSFLLLKQEHLTFHLGVPRIWKWRIFRDYSTHNDREASRALITLAARVPLPLRPWYRLLLKIHLLKNSLFVKEFLRIYSK
ncbi:hypothetical protein KKC44_02900 [Patescibacteria group bacterium]|nr:hypothetical protein [Patescibacteria group bacterium]MBU2259533.1 hypothetical protein [Patescibacteria group bacterium]